jgi:hypothetical protein
MSESKNPLRPVVIMYDENVGNYLAGSTFQMKSPESAKRVHPQARIVRYVDGGEYKEYAAKAAIRSRDKESEPETAISDAKPAAAEENTDDKKKK